MNLVRQLIDHVQMDLSPVHYPLPTRFLPSGRVRRDQAGCSKWTHVARTRNSSKGLGVIFLFALERGLERGRKRVTRNREVFVRALCHWVGVIGGKELKSGEPTGWTLVSGTTLLLVSNGGLRQDLGRLASAGTPCAGRQLPTRS